MCFFTQYWCLILNKFLFVIIIISLEGQLEFFCGIFIFTAKSNYIGNAMKIIMSFFSVACFEWNTNSHFPASYARNDRVLKIGCYQSANILIHAGLLRIWQNGFDHKIFLTLIVTYIQFNDLTCFSIWRKTDMTFRLQFL